VTGGEGTELPSFAATCVASSWSGDDDFVNLRTLRAHIEMG
jgi:hypothetical protein